MRYRCLVLDHDDTCVDSTRKVNYPQFCASLAVLRPEMRVTEDEFIGWCCDPGFYGMCREVLHYTDEELERHIANWMEYLKTHRAPFFDGIPELIRRQKDEGGLVCVISHSFESTIRPLFDHFGVTQPDVIFGAEYPDEQRKPSPFPLRELMRRYDLDAREILVVDDMPLGLTMARACGVDFGAAAWYGMPDFIREKFGDRCDYFFETVAALSAVQFGA